MPVTFRSDAAARPAIETVVMAALARVVRLPAADLRLTSRLDELGLDSLGLIHASIAIERELGEGVAISRMPDSLQTVQDVVDLVTTASGRGAEAPSCRR